MGRIRQGGDRSDLADQSHSESEQRGRSSRKWTIEAIVGLLSLSVTVTVVFFGDGWLRAEDEPPPTPSATSPAPVASATVSDTAPSTPTPSPEPTVQWTGVVRLGAGVDLDKVPPTIRTSEEKADITESSSFFVSSIKTQEQSLAPWNDSATPTRRQCIETLSTQGTTEWGGVGQGRGGG
jgi:hypothetical protein